MDQEFYREMYINEDMHWWFVARRLIIKKVIDKYFHTKQGTVLEVGCGSGGNLEMLQEYGEIFAMELDDGARSMANSRKICHVKKGELPYDIPFDDYAFDLICMLDVLEHIDDDLATLKSLRGKLNQNGILLITVPAYKFLWSGHDVVSHHKRRYTRKQLIDIVLKSGFIIKYSTYFNTFLFPIITAVRIKNKIFARNSGSDVTMPSNFVNRLLNKIFSFEQLLLPTISFPFGVSILLIAEKTEDYD